MRYFLAIVMFFCGLGLFAQDGQFSQYFTTTTLVNPSYAGIRPEKELSTNFKKSGSKERENFFELSQATLTFPIKEVTSSVHQVGGVATTFFRERRGFQGVFTSTKFLLSGAYSLRLSQFVNNFLVFGLQGGVVQNKISDDALTWGSQFNKYFGYDNTLPSETLDFSSVLYPTFNIGALYTIYDHESIYLRDKSLIVGLSADNVNRPKTNEIRKNILYRAFGSIKMELGPRLYIHPSTLILLEGGKYQINLGTYFSTAVNSIRSRNSVVLQAGAWYRQGDSFIVLGGMQFDNFKTGVSFDLNSNSFTDNVVFRNTTPSYEISLTYVLAKKKRVRRVSNPIF